jgi:predicted metalloprotease with PDZ domain
LIVDIEDEIALKEGINLTDETVTKAINGIKFSNGFSKKTNDTEIITTVKIAISSKNNLGNATIKP